MTSHIFFLFLLFCRCNCLFEDQAFKFDWKLDHVGVPSTILLSDTIDALLTLDTLGRSVSVLDAESGRIKWRNLAAKNELFVELVYVERREEARVTSILDDFIVMQRVFDASHGVLKSEKLLGVLDDSLVKVDKLVFDRENKIHVIRVLDKKLRVQIFDQKENEAFDLQTLVTGADTTKCLALSKTLLCLESETILMTTLPLNSKSKFKMLAAAQLGLQGKPVNLYALSGSKMAISGLKDQLVIDFDAEGQMGKTKLVENKNLVASCQSGEDFGLNAKENKLVFETKDNIKIEVESDSQAFKAWSMCDEEQGQLTQLVLLTDTGRLLSVTPLGNVMWTREEALGDIKLVEFVSGGLTETEDGTYDADTYVHVDSEGAGAIFQDIASHFVARLRHHLSLVHVQLRRLQRIKTEGIEALWRESSSLSDDFGLRKMIVVVAQGARSASIFGLDSKQGRLLWSIPLDANSKPVKLFIQRTALHFGQTAQATLVALSEGKPRVLVFDPLNGNVIETKEYKEQLVQAVLLHHEDEEHVRPLLLVLDNNRILTVPEKAEIDPNTFVVTTNETTIEGHHVISNGKGGYKLVPMWDLRLGEGAKIVRLLAKSTLESVHSQGRVMADRSVLFKYVNPNLALLLAEQPGDADSKSGTLEVFLIDLVSGRVLFSAVHKRVLGPFHAVHSENWAVYSLYNEKARRTELVSLELFEGPVQSNSSVFSSLSNPTAALNPLVERQTFILPTHVAAMIDSVTAKGITSKHVLVADEVSGSILDLPRHYLDPRRPTESMPVHLREPGLPPYVPELSVPDEAKLNYNRSVALVKGMASSPTGLESTSIVVVYGLDLYCTRIAPSKGFDLLKDDFDYYIISLVLSSLVVAAIVTKKLAQNKSLKQAWR